MKNTKSTEERINTWVQTIGIVVAAVWAVYTFVFTQILAPKSAPVNISTNLQVKKIGSGMQTSPMIVVELTVSATNPSVREVKLLPSVWFVNGRKLAPVDGKGFTGEKIFTVMNTRNEESIQEYVETSSPTLVAAGDLFLDKHLRPNESISRTLLFYVPDKRFDVLEVRTVVPSVSDSSDIALVWNVEKKTGQPHYDLYIHNSRKNADSEIPQADYEKFQDEHDFQKAVGHSQLSLLTPVSDSH